MPAPIAIQFDLRDFKVLAVGTRRVLASGTARAVRVALQEGAAYARANHRHKRRTGYLTDPTILRGELRSATEDGAWGYLVNEAKYARYIEEGTAAHVIRPKLAYGMQGPLQVGQSRRAKNDYGVGRGQFLRFYVGNREVFAREVHHPGTPALPFMRPASEHAGVVIVRETEQVTFQVAADLWE